MINLFSKSIVAKLTVAFLILIVLIVVAAGMLFNQTSMVMNSLPHNYMEMIMRLRTTSLIVAMVIILIAVLLLVYLFRLLRPIATITQNLHKIAQGDLRIKMIALNSKDEIGELIHSANTMTQNLRNLILQLQSSSEQLNASSRETAASTEETASAIYEITSQIQKVNELSSDGTTSVIEISQALIRLSSLIQDAKMKANTASAITGQTRDAAIQGKEAVDLTIHSIQIIRQKTTETEERMAELQQFSKQIEHITSTISEIAEQTNLLALNASIEAARAGDHGRGFAVVADEVRKLAEQTRNESASVGSTLSHILSITDVLMETTKDSQNAVKTGVEVAMQSGQALEKILDAVGKTFAEVMRIDQVTQDEVANSEQIISLIKNVGDTVEKTANSAQNVTGSTEEISSAMETISSSTEELNQQVMYLNEKVSEFQME